MSQPTMNNTLIDIYEHFVFDPKHIEKLEQLYSLISERWYEVDRVMWRLLVLLAEIRKQIKLFHNDVLRASDEPDLYNAAVYEALLDNETKIKSSLQPHINQFSIVYRGYSLN